MFFNVVGSCTRRKHMPQPNFKPYRNQLKSVISSAWNRFSIADQYNLHSHSKHSRPISNIYQSVYPMNVNLVGTLFVFDKILNWNWFVQTDWAKLFNVFTFFADFQIKFVLNYLKPLKKREYYAFDCANVRINKFINYWRL